MRGGGKGGRGGRGGAVSEVRGGGKGGRVGGGLGRVISVPFACVPPSLIDHIQSAAETALLEDSFLSEAQPIVPR